MDHSTSEENAFSHRAARFSLTCAVLVIVFLKVAPFFATPLVTGLVGLLLMVVGTIAGVLSLFGLRKYGTAGILKPAALGILFNGLLLTIFITNFSAARAKAVAARNAAASGAYFHSDSR